MIRVKDFIDREHALSLGDRILTAGYDAYINAPSIGRIGMAFYEAERDPTLLERYFAQAQSNIHELRQRCKPYASPLDVLRCCLDEIWPAGAQLETLYGKKMSVGLSRVVDENIRFLAHHDIFAKDAGQLPGTQPLGSVCL
nr:hypothetical protein [Photobacterium sp. GJ3]